MAPRNNQIDWGAISGNIQKMAGLDPAMEYKRRQAQMNEVEHQDNRALIAARLATEGMKPREIAATIAKLEAETGLIGEKTQGERFTNAARTDLWNSPDARNPLHMALGGLNASQVTGAELDRQKLGFNQRIADKGIGTEETGVDYGQLGVATAAGLNPNSIAGAFAPDKSWTQVGNNLVNPRLMGAYKAPPVGAGMPEMPQAPITNVQGMPATSGITMANGQPLAPAQAPASPAAQAPAQGTAAPSTIPGLLSFPGGGSSGGTRSSGGSQDQMIRSTDFENYNQYFARQLETQNLMSSDGKTYEQLLLPEQAQSISMLASDLMAPENAAKYGITHPGQALEMAYKIATGTSMPKAVPNEVTEKGTFWDSTSVQGMKLPNYDQGKVDEFRAGLRSNVARAMGVDPDLISKAINGTATPGTTGMLPTGASAPGTVASQISQPQPAAGKPLNTDQRPVVKASDQQLSDMQKGGTQGFTVGGVDFKDGTEVSQAIATGKVNWDPREPLLITPKNGDGSVYQAFWNPAKGVFQMAQPNMEHDADLGIALSHLTGRNDLDPTGGMTGTGKPISNLFRPVGAYEDSVDTALQAALSKGLITQDALDKAVSMDSEYDVITGKGASGMYSTSQTQQGRGVGGAYYRANLLQSVMPKLLEGQRSYGSSDYRVKDWASGNFGDATGMPTDALQVAEQMGMDRSAYGIPEEINAGISAALYPGGYASDDKAVRTGLSKFFSDVTYGRASYRQSDIGIPDVGFNDGNPVAANTMQNQSGPSDQPGSSGRVSIGPNIFGSDGAISRGVDSAADRISSFARALPEGLARSYMQSFGVDYPNAIASIPGAVFPHGVGGQSPESLANQARYASGTTGKATRDARDDRKKQTQKAKDNKQPSRSIGDILVPGMPSR